MLRLVTSEAAAFSHDDREKRLKEVESFRAELKAKPLREIKTLYEEAQEKERQALAAKAEREEQQRFFNQPDANADFIHWAKMTYWTLDEALALTFGKSPEIVKWDAVKYVDTRISPFAREYARLRELALRAKNWKQLYDPTQPSLFLAWARRNEIEVLPELVKEVEARGVVIADWKDYYDKLNEQAKKLSEQRDELIAICTKLTAERNGFKQKAVELESQVWEGFDQDKDTYPPELDRAMMAWRAATNQRDPNMTAKNQIRAWLDEHYPKLSEEAKQRIAIVCNWEKEGGRRKRE